MEAVIAPRRRRSPGRTALFVLGSLLTAGLIAVGAFLLLDLAARHSFSTTAKYSGVHSLVVRSSAGGVTLREAPPGAPLVVKANQTEALMKPRISERMAGDGTLTLTASCPGHLDCSAAYDLSVPPDVAIKVSAGFGDIHATGLRSASSIQLGTTAGDIRATGLSAPDIRLSTGLGSLTAVLTEPADSLAATTVAGDLRLAVPDTSYAVHANSGVGHVSEAGLRVDASSPRTIDATSSLGDITITPR